MAAGNPFIPSFGVPPDVLVGRDRFLAEMSEVLDGGYFLKSSTSMIFGARGMGKTVLLRVAEKRAAEKGWSVIAVSPSTGDGLMRRIEMRAAHVAAALHARHDREPRQRRRISSVNILGVGAALESVPPVADTAPEADLDALLSGIAAVHQRIGGGLLITIDEAHVAGAAEIRDFARVFQHCRGRRLPLAFLGAGLTHLRRILESGTDATVLQRCKWYDIGRLTSRQTRQTLRLTAASGGGRIADPDLNRMADVCDGYPYMIQLVGASVWAAAADPGRITPSEVDTGLREASAEFGPEVYGPIWDAISLTDKKLAVAMLYRDGASTASDLSQRWGGSSSSFYAYRARLVNAGLIRPETKGSVTFAHPSARALVLEQAKSDGWRLTPDGTPIPPAPTPDLPVAADIADMTTTPGHTT